MFLSSYQVSTNQLALSQAIHYHAHRHTHPLTLPRCVYICGQQSVDKLILSSICYKLAYSTRSSLQRTSKSSRAHSTAESAEQTNVSVHTRL